MALRLWQGIIRKIVSILVFSTYSIFVNSRIFSTCELGLIFLQNNIELSELGNWICLASAVSDRNSSKLSGTNPKLSKEYGIFQITNYYHCYDKEKPTYNDCHLNCTQLIDDNLEDDLRCAKFIKGPRDFSKVWQAYGTRCENKSLDAYTEGCDFVHGRPPSILPIPKNIILNLNSTDKRITCEAEGSQPINFKWYKFDEEVRPNQYTIEESKFNPLTNLTNSSILFELVTEDTVGPYSCSASSPYGQTRKTVQVDLYKDDNDNQSSPGSPFIIALSVLVTMVLMSLVLLGYYKCKRDPRPGALSKHQINQFYEGWSENEAASLKTENILSRIYAKPYRKFEFEISEEELEIDNNIVLGSGQFGIVYKGTLKKSKPVAVKKVKPQESGEDTNKLLLSLLDEIKVMSFIGKHPNIVELLGARTQDWKNGQIYVVLEYCPRGSLHSFLKQQRSKKILDGPDDDSPTSVIENSSDYAPNPENEVVYKKDFINYAYQIAYAMDYLTQKKIIHADLSVRNVLLLNKNVVKVTDFGLSKRMKDYQHYIRNDQEFVPWRWWAPESLCDFTFTSKSDVWSYAVALWEVFSLAAVPYPEQKWNPEFSLNLNNGLRLLKPDLAPDNMYEIMKNCWMVKPEDRPTFHSICNELRQILRKYSKYDEGYYESAFITSDDDTIL